MIHGSAPIQTRKPKPQMRRSPISSGRMKRGNRTDRAIIRMDWAIAGESETAAPDGSLVRELSAANLAVDRGSAAAVGLVRVA